MRSIKSKVMFSFSFKGKRSFPFVFSLNGLCCVFFLIHDECGTGLNVEFPISLLRNDYSGNQILIVSVVTFFSALLGSIFTAYSHSGHGDFSSFARNNFIFCGISTVVFLVLIQVIFFDWVYLVMQDFFLQSKLYVSLEFFFN